MHERVKDTGYLSNKYQNCRGVIEIGMGGEKKKIRGEKTKANREKNNN